MISGYTTDKICREIIEWTEEHNIEGDHVLELIKRISEVEGNQSFKDSIKKIWVQLWKILKKRGGSNIWISI